jgi:hypothetical protein
MYRFTIRELVLFTLVVGLALGWWLDRRALVAESSARWDRIYDLTMELKGRYPSPSEMSPPWRDPRGVLSRGSNRVWLDQAGNEPAKASQ